MSEQAATWTHWQPFSTVPIGRPVWLARFPAPAGEKPWFGVIFYPELITPKPTHWANIKPQGANDVRD